MTIQTVFFDMGGTLERLWYTADCRRKAVPALVAMLKTAGMVLALNDQEYHDLICAGYARYHRWSMESMEELPTQRVWAEYILAGQPVDPVRLGQISEDLMFTLEQEFFLREIRPEVPEVLEKLKGKGYKIGLISNVCSRGFATANLEKYGIRNYFDPIVLSCDYGRRKPDPAIFHYAARLANAPTRNCAHIGDRIARDIVGARKAGYSLVVQIVNDFDFGEEDSGAEPDAVIHRLDQLEALLEEQPVDTRHLCSRGSQATNQVRAFLFDAGDILYHRPHGYRRLKAFLYKLGLADRAIPAEKQKGLKDMAFNGSISQVQYREEILKLYGITDPGLLERGRRAIEEDENGVQFFKGVRETLLALKERGYLLGIITDTANPIHVKLEWFERAGIVDVWDSFISSKEIGVEKPNPRAYAAALTQLGLLPDQAVFVGHSPEELKGAQMHGMKTVAFNYKESTRADYYVDKFEDLLKLPVLALETQLE